MHCIKRPYRFALLTLALGALFCSPQARAANDPNLEWKTLETPHFRISYYSGEKDVAQHLGEIGEAIHARLTPVLGWSPKVKTEIALTDQTDSANGITSGLPYNSIRLFLTAPDDMSPLGDIDDWYEDLLSHEYTHTIHIDNITGLPALINGIIGRTFVPNQVQPRWILEGLAVLEESEQTSGGRLRSSQWNMFMRADVLENNIATLDEFSNTPRRWPQGNIWYLYGSFFLKWVRQTYGEEAIRKMIADYGSNIVPFGVNRAIRRATGRTFEDMYPAWIATLKRDFEAQSAAIRANGIREGVRLTHGGQTARHPRWIPGNAWNGYAGDLLYFRDDGHSTAGLYGQHIKRDARGNVTAAGEDKRELLIRTNEASAASFEPDGSVVFDSVDYTSNLFAFGELFEIKSGLKSSSGLEGHRKRLTHGFRASDPDVSPDGRRVVFSTNHRGTSYLQIADLSVEGEISNTRSLVKSNGMEQVYGAHWSPDNVHVSYSVWTKGGYRDIRYVDSTDGSFVEVTKDRAIDSGPSFSPDAKWLYFHSDRTGVSNIYAWEVATGHLKQITNVINGAYQPSISPDGKTMAYVGYTHAGFDVFAMPVDPAAAPEAAPFVDDRPHAHADPPHQIFPVSDYNPLHTLRPRAFSLQITPGNFGQAIIFGVAGGDIAGHHSITGTLTTEVERPEVQFNLGYGYGRLPFDVGLNAYRSIAPHAGYSLGQNYKPAYIQEAVGVSSGIAYSLPGAFDGQSVSATYAVTRLGSLLPNSTGHIDPYETPSIPATGTLGTLSLGWGYSNAQRFLWSIGPEKGFSLSANLDFTNPALASDFTGFAASTSFAAYTTMPWLQHHSLGFHASGGTSGGNFPGHGPYYVGGFVDLPVYDTVRNILIQGGVTLRGYPSVIEAGRNFALFNAEYRFPLLNIDRGLSTLPIFLQRISGNVFVDYGSAFDLAETAKFKTGTGAELWFDSLLGYVIGFTFRLGYAHGWASGGLDKVYFVAAVPF